MGIWRSGNASDFGSEDRRFDPYYARLFIQNNQKENNKEKKKDELEEERREKKEERRRIIIIITIFSFRLLNK